MAQYIDKDALVAEIDKEIKRIYAGREYVGIPLDEENRVYGLQIAKGIIDTLEVKEVDLEKEINLWQGCEAFPEGVGITPLPKAMEIVERTAKHFFELGVQQSKNYNNNEE